MRKRSPLIQKMKFPYRFEKNGRHGTIYKTGDGRFKTHFQFAKKSVQNMFAAPEAALEYLESEFLRLDTEQENSQTIFPVRAKAREVFDLEQLLAERGGGANLRDAVNFYVAFSKVKKFAPKTVSECVSEFLRIKAMSNDTQIHIATLAKHFRRFEKTFGCRFIHEITSLEVTDWLGRQISTRTKKPWKPKTRNSVRGSLVTLSIFAQDDLNAIPEGAKTEFQRVKKVKEGNKPPVEIYSPAQLRALFETALKKESHFDLIPVIAIGCFLGLRPFEVHGEGLERDKLKWEHFNWNDDQLHVEGQKVRSIPTRDIPLNDAIKAWLEPFRELCGPIWGTYKKSHERKMATLRKEAKVEGIYDGYRHSYASYRVRILKMDLKQLAYEMGNSEREIIASYKRNVTDKDAEMWFSVMPPDGYSQKIAAELSRKASLNLVKANEGINV